MFTAGSTDLPKNSLENPLPSSSDSSLMHKKLRPLDASSPESDNNENSHVSGYLVANYFFNGYCDGPPVMFTGEVLGQCYKKLNGSYQYFGSKVDCSDFKVRNYHENNCQGYYNETVLSSTFNKCYSSHALANMTSVKYTCTIGNQPVLPVDSLLISTLDINSTCGGVIAKYKAFALDYCIALPNVTASFIVHANKKNHDQGQGQGQGQDQGQGQGQGQGQDQVKGHGQVKGQDQGQGQGQGQSNGNGYGEGQIYSNFDIRYYSDTKCGAVMGSKTVPLQCDVNTVNLFSNITYVNHSHYKLPHDYELQYGAGNSSYNNLGQVYLETSILKGHVNTGFVNQEFYASSDCSGNFTAFHGEAAFNCFRSNESTNGSYSFAFGSDCSDLTKMHFLDNHCAVYNHTENLGVQDPQSTCVTLSTPDVKYPFMKSYKTQCIRSDTPLVPFDSVIFGLYGNDATCSSQIQKFEAVATNVCLNLGQQLVRNGSHWMHQNVSAKFSGLLNGGAGYDVSYYLNSTCHPSMAIIQQRVVPRPKCNKGFPGFGPTNSTVAQLYHDSLYQQGYCKSWFSPGFIQQPRVNGFVKTESYASFNCAPNTLTTVVSQSIGMCLSEVNAAGETQYFRYNSKSSDCSDLSKLYFNDSLCEVFMQGVDLQENGIHVGQCYAQHNSMLSTRYSCTVNPSAIPPVPGIVFSEYYGNNKTCSGEVIAYQVVPTGKCIPSMGNIMILANPNDTYFTIKQYEDFRCIGNATMLKQNYSCGLINSGELLHHGNSSHNDGIYRSTRYIVPSQIEIYSRPPPIGPPVHVKLGARQHISGVNYTAYLLNQAKEDLALKYAIASLFVSSNGYNPVSPDNITDLVVTPSEARRLQEIHEMAMVRRMLSSSSGVSVSYTLVLNTSISGYNASSMSSTLNSSVSSGSFTVALKTYAASLGATALSNATSVSTSSATTSTSISSSGSSSNSSAGLSGGAIAGIVIGIFVLIAVSLVVFFFNRQNRYKNEVADSTTALKDAEANIETK